MMSVSIARSSAALAAMVLVISACSRPAEVPIQASSTAPDDRSGTPSDQPSVTTVPEILRFTAPQLGGGIVHGADHAGEDVALWFWAPW